MKMVYGNKRNALMVGVAEIGGRHTPFFGLVGTDELNKTGFVQGVTKCDEMIKIIDESGGVVIYVDNPDAAQTVHEMLSMLFEAASTTDWNKQTEVEAVLQ